MKIHKIYECEHCGQEFDADEYERAVQHEKNCEFNPCLKNCASCTYARLVSHYEEPAVKCDKHRKISDVQSCWKAK